MKKLLSIMSALTITGSSSLTVISCSRGKSNELKIVFVPSRSPSEILPIIKPLEGLLEAKIKELYPAFQNRAVKINVSTDYNAAGQALKDGKTDLAFLPMGTYQQYHGAVVNGDQYNYDKAAPLVIAQRYAMKPDSDLNKDRQLVLNKAESIALINKYNELSPGITNKEQAYNTLYTGPNDKKATTFYRSEVIINNDFLKEAQDEKQIDIAGLEDESKYSNVIQQLIDYALTKGQNSIRLMKSNSSGAGVVSPVQWMIDNGISNSKIKTIFKDQARANNYGEVVEAVATGSSKIGFGYTDIRADSKDVKTAYEKTTMIGLTTGIPNDGISYSKTSLTDQKLIAALRNSFKALITDPANAKIFGVYSHTDYEVPAANASPEEALKWEKEQNKVYQDAEDKTKQANELISKLV